MLLDLTKVPRQIVVDWDVKIFFGNKKPCDYIDHVERHENEVRTI